MSATLRLVSSLRDTLRAAERRPMAFVMPVIILALVTAAAGAITAVASAAFLRPLPFPEPHRLVRLYTMPPGARTFSDANPFAPLPFVRARAALGPFAGIEGIWVRDRTIGGDGDPEAAPVGGVSAGFLSLLGGAPALGRVFSEDEDRAAARVVVIGHGVWTRRFGADPGVLGRLLSIDREPHEIIGVMPAAFEPAFTDTELWTPLGIRDGRWIMPAATFIQTIGQLRPGARLDAARQHAAAVYAAARDEAPGILQGWEVGVLPLRDAQFGLQRPAILLLVGAAVLLGLIAAVNLAHLALADLASRRGELALRLALGATRRDLLRGHLVDALCTVGAGAAIGLPIAWLALPVLTSLDPTGLARSVPVQIDWRVALITVGALAVVTTTVSAIPVWRATRRDLAATIALDDRRSTSGRGSLRLRTILVAMEMAVAVLLLAGSAMVLDALRRSSRIDPGFDPTGVIAAQLRLPETAYPTDVARAAFVTQALERVRAVPGVTDASTTLNRYVPGFAYVTLVQMIDGRPLESGLPATVQFRRISPGYFATLRIPVRRGRTFDTRDGKDAQPVAVVSEAFARQFWPNQDPIGRTLRRGTADTRTVIGVVGDVSDVRVGEAPQAALYIPYSQNNTSGTPIGLVVRSSRRTADLLPALKAAIAEVDPMQPLANVTSLERFVIGSFGPQRFRSTLLLVLAGLGLLLASVGLYGVTGRTVMERQREAGVRLALGASRGRVWWTVAARAMRGVLIGAVVGALTALAAQRGLVAALPELAGGSPIGTALPAFGVLLAVGLIAAGLPARRAARLDPLRALRAD